jgi:abortive infection bacteriophage resistance protein
MEHSRKIFLTYDEQIKLLKNRGLNITDKDNARHYLEYFGYFDLINGYKDLFLKNRATEKYKPNVDFSDIVGLYMYDYYLRSDLLSALYLVEKSLKSVISYTFSKKYGEDDSKYLLPSSFDTRPHSEDRVVSTIRTMKNLIHDNNQNGNKTICHYIQKHGYIPLWVLFTIATFGNVSVFYANMKDKDKSTISARYGLNSNELSSMMYFLTHIRNACAHGHRVYTFGSDSRRPLTIPRVDLHYKLELPNNEGLNDILAVIICCYYLLPKNSLEYLIVNLKNRLEQIKKKRFYSGVINKTNLRIKYLNNILTLK